MSVIPIINYYLYPSYLPAFVTHQVLTLTYKWWCIVNRYRNQCKYIPCLGVLTRQSKTNGLLLLKQNLFRTLLFNKWGRHKFVEHFPRMWCILLSTAVPQTLYGGKNIAFNLTPDSCKQLKLDLLRVVHIESFLYCFQLTFY